MIDFSMLQGLTIPEGVVTQIEDASGRVIWAVKSGGKVILEVEKITSNTYAGETTYTAEEFILLDIYPKTNGTVKVTYGGLTKTITDTSGAEEPNAQQVFFGAFNGVSDEVETPASGELVIDGDCYAFGCGSYYPNKLMTCICPCICSISSFGNVDRIPTEAFSSLVLNKGVELKFNQTYVKIPPAIKSIGNNAFVNCDSLVNVELSEGLECVNGNVFNKCVNLVSVTIPRSVNFIGVLAFGSVRTIEMLGEIPPEAETQTIVDADVQSSCFGVVSSDTFVLEKIIVPKGCGDTYKTATGWSIYADYIVEAS